DVDSDTYTGSLVDPHWVTFTFPEFTPTVGQNYVIRVNIGPNWTYPNSLFYEGANGTGSNSVTIGDYTIPEMSVVINGTAEATRAWGLKIGTAATPKGVVGPIDPDDLANYSDASTNTFLRKT